MRWAPVAGGEAAPFHLPSFNFHLLLQFIDHRERDRDASVRRGCASRTMPVSMTFNGRPPISPPKHDYGGQFTRAPVWRPRQEDPAEMERAAKANELLNLRSKNINYILEQRSQAENQFAATSAIKLPEKNPRIDELHYELGIDKVVLVKCPFEIDTTPGGQWKPQAVG